MDVIIIVIRSYSGTHSLMLMYIKSNMVIYFTEIHINPPPSKGY